MKEGMKICNCKVTVKNYKHFTISGMSVGQGDGVGEFGKALGHEVFCKSF